MLTHPVNTTQVAYEKIVDTSFTFSPLLAPDQVCKHCVKDNFDGKLQCFILFCQFPHPTDLERLYQIEHPQIVSQFDEVNKREEDSKGSWISKLWLKSQGVEIFMCF